MVKESKQKCECGHAKDVHMDEKDNAECCVQYRGKDGYIKCCSCTCFKPKTN